MKKDGDTKEISEWLRQQNEISEEEMKWRAN